MEVLFPCLDIMEVRKGSRKKVYFSDRTTKREGGG